MLLWWTKSHSSAIHLLFSIIIIQTYSHCITYTKNSFCIMHTIQENNMRRTQYSNLSVWHTIQILISSTIQHKYKHIMQDTSCDTNFLLRCKHNKTHMSIKGSGELLITQLQIPHHAAPTQKLHNMQSRDEFYMRLHYLTMILWPIRSCRNSKSSSKSAPKSWHDNQSQS